MEMHSFERSPYRERFDEGFEQLSLAVEQGIASEDELRIAKNLARNLLVALEDCYSVLDMPYPSELNETRALFHQTLQEFKPISDITSRCRLEVCSIYGSFEYRCFDSGEYALAEIENVNRFQLQSIDGVDIRKAFSADTDFAWYSVPGVSEAFLDIVYQVYGVFQIQTRCSDAVDVTSTGEESKFKTYIDEGIRVFMPPKRISEGEINANREVFKKFSKPTKLLLEQIVEQLV